MYAPSNVYGNSITPQTVLMTELVMIVLELQHHVRICTSFDSIWIINSLEPTNIMTIGNHKRPISDDTISNLICMFNMSFGFTHMSLFLQLSTRGCFSSSPHTIFFPAKHTSEKQEMERTVEELQKNIDNEFHGMSSLFVWLSWNWHLNFVYLKFCQTTCK